ncbi:MAG: Ig-like domain-containing protein [Ignavibacteriae bacterium]|nr:Ig-like domain-containing protein [Ignavibacteriota bacterium]
MKQNYFFIIISVIGVLLTFNSDVIAQEYATDANTVLLLHMNETSGVVINDESGNGNHGTASGATIDNGKFGNARNFLTVNDYVNIDDNPLLDFSISRKFTVDFWINVSPTSHSDVSVISKMGGGSDEDDDWRFVLAGNNRIFFDVNSSTTGGSPDDVIGSTMALPTGRWVHIAGVWDGNNHFQHIYINGTLDTSNSSVIGTIAHTSIKLRLGHEQSVGTVPMNSFFGLLDEVRISNKPREPWEFNYPVVKTVTPSQNALNIPKSTNISATFNVAMNTTTLNASNILIHGSQSGKHAGVITPSGDTAFTFDPTTDFMAGEIINVTLTKNITSASGDSLTNGYHWSFTVATMPSCGIFTTKVDYQTGTYPYSVYASDVDNNGSVDILTANMDAYTVSVLKNIGDGTFAD